VATLRWALFRRLTNSTVRLDPEAGALEKARAFGYLEEVGGIWRRIDAGAVG
jgi:hypothetical protein